MNRGAWRRSATNAYGTPSNLDANGCLISKGGSQLRTFILFTLCTAITTLSVAAPRPPLTLGGVSQTYTVAKGDHLYEIARGRGFSYTALARANGIDNPNIVRAGAVLMLPTRFILPDTLQNGIVINVPEYRLYLLHHGAVAAVFPVAIGLPTWQTPVGEFTVTNRVENPAWYMPPDMASRENVKREIIPAGPDNPLGDFWIGTSLTHTGIHGTNRPMSIGRALSHGCMRMYPEHIDSLFRQVIIGESGMILYEPIKVSVSGDSVWIEVHPDVYEEIADLSDAAKRQLQGLGVWDKVDRQLLELAIEQARGIPEEIQKR
jgi:L,D-transpeptidase ErfK/SrfK